MNRILRSAFLLFLFLQSLSRAERFSIVSPSKPAAEEPISILRVGSDIVVRWLCPPFQKTTLLGLDGEIRWGTIDDASTAVPETQYYFVPRDESAGFFRTSLEELEEFPRLRVMMPSRFVPGLATPIRVEVLRNDGFLDWEVWSGEVPLTFSSNLDYSPAGPVPLHNGVGSGVLSIYGEGNGAIRADFDGESATKWISPLRSPPEEPFAGELSDPLTVWKPADGVVHIVGDVTVPSGHVLRIYPDTVILLDPKKSIIVSGAIESLGTVEHPVLFAAANPNQPWGEISHRSGSAKSTYRGTFFIGGGDSPGAGHTGRGPVIRVDDAEIVFDYCNFMDNYGKGLYSTHGKLTFTSCLFSRCAMGMEVVDTDILVDRCFFLEMPMGGDIADNDPLYLHGQGNMSVTNSIFALGGDDGIDTLGSFPLIENCIVHGFLDKGISVYYGTTRINNCLILSNDYGISAKGDGTNVYVDNTTLFGNRRSLQSRNKYGVPDAVIKYFVTNSILWQTEEAVRTDYGLEDISISYSDVQGSEVFPGEGNINADPLFIDFDANNFRLRDDSPCRGAGQNGADMGCDCAELP